MGVGGERQAPAALPPGMTWYSFYRTLGKPQGRSGRVLKISPPPGFDPRTIQHQIRPAQGPTQPPVQWIPGYFLRTSIYVPVENFVFLCGK
jgi:hypothetical protein